MGNIHSVPQQRRVTQNSQVQRKPISSIVQTNKKTKDKFKELLERLMHNTGAVDDPGEHGMTALHFAVLRDEELCVKTLIAFGADVNAMNDFKQTPLDIANQNQKHNLLPLLLSVGCVTGEEVLVQQSRSDHHRPVANPASPQGASACKIDSPPGTERRKSEQQFDFRGSPVSVRSTSANDSSRSSPQLEDDDLDDLQQQIDMRLDASASLNPQEAYVLAMQLREVKKRRSALGRRNSLTSIFSETPALHTPGPPLEFRVQGGSRILSLDGGGIRGLIQIEVLCEIERMTGKKITELFDWIVGSSTGGVLALGLVYCGMSLEQLRRLYFRLKEEVFSQGGIRYGFSTTTLEKILKEELGTRKLMSDVKQPKILISAVNKSRTPLKLTFFNNCFEDEFSTQPIWKVARYTSAAPMYFSEYENYVDGGVLANNPCQDGLSRIQQFYQEQEARLQIACVVSVGSGIYPTEEMGSTNLRIVGMINSVQNLFRLINSALSNSEAVADHCRSKCESENIPFYRFSPQLDEKIDPGETDNLKLLNMIITTRMHMHSQDAIFDRLVPLLLTHCHQSRVHPSKLQPTQDPNM